MTMIDDKAREASNRLRRSNKTGPVAESSSIASPPPAALAPQDKSFTLDNEDPHVNHLASSMEIENSMETRNSAFEMNDENRTKKAVREPDEARTAGRPTSKREGKRWSTKGTIFNGRKHRSDGPPRENASTESRKIVVLGSSKSTTSDNSSVTHGEPSDASSIAGPYTPAELATRNRELEDALEMARSERAKMEEEVEHYRRRSDLYEEDIRAYREEARQDHEGSSRPVSRSSSLEEDRNLELAGLADEREFWKRRYSEVNRERLRQEKELRSQLLERQLSMRKDWEMKTIGLTADLERAQRSNHEAQRNLDYRNEEIRELQRQVLDLKRSISMSTRTEGQVTDDVFREHMQTLGHDLQNWTINNFRRSKLDASTLSEQSKSEFLSAVPKYKSLILSNRLAVVQAYVSKILVDHIFQSVFFGLSEARIEQFLAMDEYMNTIGTPTSLNQWRSVSLAMLRHTNNSGFREELSSLTHDVVKRITATLSEMVGSPLLDTCIKQLQSIVDQSVNLSHLFRVQRAQFSVNIPFSDSTKELLFDNAIMEDANGMDEDELEGSRVFCVIFPAVFKNGDESGNNLHLHNVIVKAKVVAQPE